MASEAGSSLLVRLTDLELLNPNQECFYDFFDLLVCVFAGYFIWFSRHR